MKQEVKYRVKIKPVEVSISFNYCKFNIFRNISQMTMIREERRRPRGRGRLQLDYLSDLL
jgi:hypothetical protein